MSLSNHEYVNFSQDQQLNNHLRQVHKHLSAENRLVLRMMGRELRAGEQNDCITHTELNIYINVNLHRLH